MLEISFAKISALAKILQTTYVRCSFQGNLIYVIWFELKLSWVELPLKRVLRLNLFHFNFWLAPKTLHCNHLQKYFTLLIWKNMSDGHWWPPSRPKHLVKIILVMEISRVQEQCNCVGSMTNSFKWNKYKIQLLSNTTNTITNMFAGALTGGSQAAAFLLLLIAPQVTLIYITDKYNLGSESVATGELWWSMILTNVEN